ncbi:glycosyltransferase family 2 protein [Labrys miyagiensis]|uniref:glycosyltransferase family 2 protein n=1 Tax=Labrys miyagiensis TaxID=346912 RepID=UPI0024E0CF7B|nr:glycosyltransferase family 2 protein [Labrys miyagiensis]
MRISLVMATLGRSKEIALMLDSLETQTFRDFEVLIVDQNADDRVAGVLAAKPRPFPIQHVRAPAGPAGSKQRGASWARNIGARCAGGDILGFPDDDCTYPPHFLEKVVETFENTGADIVNGRAADETGRSINGRFATGARWTGPKDVFRTVIEWVSFCKRSAFEAVGGYDENVGAGAPTPWQSCEGPDVMLRMMAKGYRAYYDQDIYGHHPEMVIDIQDAHMQQKVRGYGRGMGYVLAKNRLGLGYSLNYMARSLGGCLVSLAKGRRGRAIYYMNTLTGRVEGFFWRFAFRRVSNK